MKKIYEKPSVELMPLMPTSIICVSNTGIGWSGDPLSEGGD